MNTREIAGEYRLAHWTEVMRERADRGISIRAYCEEAGIHENTYFYWQRKLREAACTEIKTATEGKSLMPNGWTSLCVREESAKAQGLTVEVGGCRITVSANTDPELLAKVCRTLKSL
jgi:putative transposase